MSCSINIKPDGTGICLTKDDILILIKTYNQNHPSTPISTSGSKETLWNRILQRMNKKCKSTDQVCVIQQVSTNPSELIRDNFKPKGPKRQYDWLSTSDINNVMYHYEKLYPTFTFMGAIPRDFFNILKQIGNAKSVKKMSKKSKKIGLVFNTDKHNQSGSHWLAVFIDFENDPITIEHFDSVGSPPMRDINKFLTTIKNRINDDNLLGQNKTATILINKKQHQRGNNDCGVYSLHYIIERLKGRTFDDITQTVIRDSEMNKRRLIYFRQDD